MAGRFTRALLVIQGVMFSLFVRVAPINCALVCATVPIWFATYANGMQAQQNSGLRDSSHFTRWELRAMMILLHAKRTRAKAPRRNWAECGASGAREQQNGTRRVRSVSVHSRISGACLKSPDTLCLEGSEHRRDVDPPQLLLREIGVVVRNQHPLPLLAFDPYPREASLFGNRPALVQTLHG
jgi:hypothetical protein